MKKVEGKRDDLCVVQGCKNRRDQESGNFRCEKHSIMYYGGMVGLGRSTGLKDPDVFNE
jgi:hypothetical protein